MGARRVLAGAVLAVVSMGTAALAADPAYSVTPVLAPSGVAPTLDVRGMNNSGQVVSAFVTEPAVSGFVWNRDGSTTLVPVDGNSSVVTDVNDSGQVCGYGDSGLFVWDSVSGTTTHLPSPPGWTRTVGPITTAINNRGQVVCNYLDFVSSRKWQGYLYDGGTITPLATPDGNDNGMRLGSLGTCVSKNDSGSLLAAGTANWQPFITGPGGAVAIPLPAGSNRAIAYGVNSSGQVVGECSGAGTYSAFIGTTSSSALIPRAAGSDANWDCIACSINDEGQVVGYDDGYSYSACRAWIWDAASGTRYLNDLVPAGWNVQMAGPITNDGYILGWVEVPPPPEGGLQAGPVPVLLTPVPEPATVSLLALGALGAIRGRRRRA